jgi:hypothetical protein
MRRIRKCIRPVGIGLLYPSLPAGCMYRPLLSTYECGGGVWLSAAYGANGVYYRVVPAP